MKILVTGAEGMLGSDLIPALEKSHTVVPTDLEQLDIGDRAACISFIGDFRPDILINCAALTDVDGCETKQQLAFKINGRAAGYLSEACKGYGARLIHISTDYIFDGQKKTPYVETDRPMPLSVYGKSKWLGETEVHRWYAGSPNFLILRSGWLYGHRGKNFVEAILTAADTRDYLEVVDDQTGCPTHTLELVQTILVAIEKDLVGTFNAVCSGQTTWYDFAVEILKQAGKKTPVHRIDTKKLNRPALRPKFSVLATAKLLQQTGHALRSWEEALKDYLTA